MNTRLLSRLAAGTAAALAILLGGAPAVAQDSANQNSANDDALDEITVFGVRSSIETAVREKRESDTILDGIAAEGIGRFPDLNLADSLSRVTGVQIDRADAGGERREGQVALRGLPNFMARTTVNGQTLAAPNFDAGFLYGVFESDIVSGVNVVKSPTARYDEGGLSGIVDIRTLRPLSLDENFFSISAETDYEELSEDNVGKFGISFGRIFADDRAAIFASAKWADQSFQVDSARVTSYQVDDLDGDGLGDLYTPRDARVTTRINDGDRISLAAGIEVAPTDSIKLGLLAVHSEYNIDNDLDVLRVRNATNLTAVETVSGGTFGDTVTSVVFENPRVEAESRIFEDEYSSSAITADIEWTNDIWTARGVIHYTKGEQDRLGIQSRRRVNNGAGNGLDILIDTGAGDVDGFRLVAQTGDLSAPSTWAYGASPTGHSTPDEARILFIPSTGIDRSEEETAFQLDVSRDFDGSFFTVVEGGIKFRALERTNLRPSFSTSGIDFSVVDDLGVLRPSFATSNFFGGNLSQVDNYLVADWSETRDDLLAGNTISGPTFGGFPLSISNTQTFDADRDILTGYIMVRFDGENLAANLPIRGNFGIRHVETDRDVQAFRRGDIFPDGEETLNAKTDFSHTLPSLNVVWDINEDMLLRFGLSEAMTRPNANAFRVGQTVDVVYVDPAETIVDTVSISLGNPDLRPFTADAVDLSFEWYNREGSVISAAFFHKKIENGIESRTLCPSDPASVPGLGDLDLTGIITGQLTEVGGVCQDSTGAEVSITDRVNNSDSFKISGWELSMVQNFDFLQSPFFSKMGVQANYTYVDASEGPNFDASGNRLPLPGVSEDTANFIVYYEAEKFGARLAYNYRSDFFTLSTGTFSGDDRFVASADRLDLSTSYAFNEDLVLQAEIFNLTDERRQEYQGVVARMRDIRYTGRTYTLGVRYRF